MRVAVLAVLVGSGLVIGVLGANLRRSDAYDRSSTSRGGDLSGAGELIALSSDCGDGYNQLTVIDRKARVVSVYHVNRATGKISLKSVRNIHWDLMMDEFNGDNPPPREIRALLEQR